jgi:hypothetical protein
MHSSLDSNLFASKTLISPPFSAAFSFLVHRLQYYRHTDVKTPYDSVSFTILSQFFNLRSMSINSAMLFLYTHCTFHSFRRNSVVSQPISFGFFANDTTFLALIYCTHRIATTALQTFLSRTLCTHTGMSHSGLPNPTFVNNKSPTVGGRLFSTSVHRAPQNKVNTSNRIKFRS